MHSLILGNLGVNMRQVDPVPVKMTLGPLVEQGKW
jgi:hypothetical protein